MRNCNQPQCCGSCNCNSPCGTAPCSSTPCKGTITEAELGELLYIAGLDVNLCKKYQLVGNILGLRDCANNPIVPGTQIVTCAAFQDRLCAVFAALPDGGPLAAGDVVIGANCERLTVPAFQAPLTVTDTSTVDHTLAGNILSSVVRVSADAGNILETHADGLYVDIDAADLCPALGGLSAGAVAAAGTLLVGADCQTHALPPLQAPLTFQDTSSVDFTQVGNVVSATVILSPNAGNQATNPGNGIYVPPGAGETPITVVDTSTVNLTASGTANHTLQADVVISPNPGNLITNPGNGLFASFDEDELCETLGGFGIGAPATTGTLLLGNDCQFHAFPDVGDTITVDDTVTVDLTLNAGEITADVNISAIPGNIITVQGDGLAVTCANVAACVNVDVGITAIDTSTVNTTINEGLPNQFTVQSDVIISPNAGNAITNPGNGLFVAPAAVTCAGVVAAFPDNGNTLQPGDEVLTGACEAKEFPNFTGVDTNCIDTTVAQVVGGFAISSTPIINTTHPTYPVGCNGLVCGPGGLSVPPDTTVTEGESTLGGFTVNGPMVQGQTIASPVITLNIVNPSTCREALLTLEMIIPSVTWQSDANFGALEIEGNHSFNLPGFTVTPFAVFTRWRVIGAANSSSGTPPASRIQGSFIIPPGFVGSYSVQWNVTDEVANGTNVQVGNVGARYTLVAAGN